MKWYSLLALSLLGGLLLAFSWYPHGLTALIFIAFIPLLFLSDALLQKGSKVAFWKGFGSSYPAFFVWNAITTYWIVYCTVPGGIAAVVLNAMLQALVFGLWHACRKRIPQQWLHPIVLVAFWMAFEYLHLNWELTWPWLNLGNVFASSPSLVQWYSATGAFGGTLWILTVNILIYYVLKNLNINKTKLYGFSSAAILLLFIFRQNCLIKRIFFRKTYSAAFSFCCNNRNSS